ncbi:MAG: UvrABC system protein C [Micavibrio sp.]|nr:MAG: UvrABC system protein C [Micavibrio sp.]
MAEEKNTSSVEQGVKTIIAALGSLPNTPGVYRMLSDKGEALYVGKAKSLKKRVASYTKIERQPIRLQRMIAQTKAMEFVQTHTEAEALLLESNLIKKLKPRYNVLLRDDKSFPYILLTGDHDCPQVMKHRGAKKRKGTYYGPFAGAGDVNRTIATLQRAFMLRNCTDNYFAQRSRPCLQYHIKRCTAPCVGHVTSAEYGEQVAQAKDFLDGKSKAIQARFAKDMQKSSADEDYEKAGEYRDRIKALTAVQSHQDIEVSGIKDADVMGLYQKAGKACIQVFFFRAGRNYGNRSYFPRHDKDDQPEHVLSAFMAQFYENKPVPREIVVSHAVEEKVLLEEALGSKVDHGVKIVKPARGARRRLLDFVLKNAAGALKRNMAEQAAEVEFLNGVAELFGMDEPPARIEVFDNSHISGTNMVGAMIVAGAEGFRKNSYRKFNIKKADASDDVGMMREVMERRFGRALKEGVDRSGEDWPDLLLIDGGQGQFNAVKDVLEEFGILAEVTLVSIAKGEDRNAGRERFFMESKKPFQLPVNDPVLHYLQRLRDEAHRFAIGSHRVRRKKQMVSSPLDDIAGIGAKRKKALLHHFGSGKEVAKAGIEDLEAVEGISKAVAQKIYDHFH